MKEFCEDDRIDLSVKKCVHISIPTELHAIIKNYAATNSTSIQAVTEKLMWLIADGDPYIITQLRTIPPRKAPPIITKMRPTDADAIFDLIEEGTT